MTSKPSKWGALLRWQRATHQPPLARQQRLAIGRRTGPSNRAGTRAGADPTDRSSCTRSSPVVVAAVVVGGALLLTSGSKPKQPLGTPNPPVGSFITPTSVTASGRTLGNANAPHTIDIYEDFQCPNCWIFTHDIEPQIIANYVADRKGQARLPRPAGHRLRHGRHGVARRRHAARCAEDQGMFWPYHDLALRQSVLRGIGRIHQGFASRPSARWSGYRPDQVQLVCRQRDAHATFSRRRVGFQAARRTMQSLRRGTAARQLRLRDRYRLLIRAPGGISPEAGRSAIRRSASASRRRRVLAPSGRCPRAQPSPVGLAPPLTKCQAF